MMVGLVVCAGSCAGLREEHALSVVRIVVGLLLDGCCCIGKVKAGLGAER